jgi:hypothetical protein
MTNRERGDDEFDVWEAIVADLTGQLDTSGVQETSDAMIDELLSDGTFEPPEPPPIKVPADLISRLAWGGALGGPTLVVMSSILGLGATGVGAGLIAFVAGFGVLIVRMKDGRDDDSDGAVV